MIDPNLDRRRRDPVVVFFQKTKRATSGPLIGGVRCLEWTGGRFEKGYGAISVGGKARRAHRFAYATFKGPIPEGMKVCHKCDNPPCAEVAHLFLGSDADNLADMTAKGRRYISRGEEMGTSKLSEREVVAIREAYRDGHSQAKVAKRFGVSQAVVGGIARGELWSHVGGPLSPNNRMRRARGSSSPNAKLTDDQVRDIRLRYAAGGISQTVLGAEYGVVHTVVGKIVRREMWRHVA